VLPAAGFVGIAWGTLFAASLQALIIPGMILLPSRMRMDFGSTKAGFSKKRRPPHPHWLADWPAWMD
jgi:hypothetical protein